MGYYVDWIAAGLRAARKWSQPDTMRTTVRGFPAGRCRSDVLYGSVTGAMLGRSTRCCMLGRQ
jgi:hypothetical protein